MLGQSLLLCKNKAAGFLLFTCCFLVILSELYHCRYKSSCSYCHEKCHHDHNIPCLGFNEIWHRDHHCCQVNSNTSYNIKMKSDEIGSNDQSTTNNPHSLKQIHRSHHQFVNHTNLIMLHVSIGH